MQLIQFLFYSLIIIIFLCSCEPTKINPQEKPYNGPILKAYKVFTILSDSAKQKVSLKTPLQLEFIDGNQEFPKGVEVIYYDEKKQPYAKLTANFAQYFKNENKYKATGNVIVYNMQKKEELKTEELNWTPNNQKIFTDKGIIITTPTELLTGNGLTARQDFKEYIITNPTGRFSLNK
jgi:LPS export ABC transporter protein LptC